MKFSLIIPIYNVELYIEHCLASVLNQNFTDYEVILVDDCGTDRSVEIAKTFITKAQPKCAIQWIHHTQNRGLSASRNDGLREAHGEWVWFIDSDDTITSDALSYLAEHIDSEINIATAPILFSGNNPRNGKIDVNLPDAILTREQYITNNGLIHTNQRFLLRRTFLLMNNLYFTEGIIHEDEEMGIKLLFSANKIQTFSYPLYHYFIRTDGGNIMGKWGQKNIDSIWTIGNNITALMSPKTLSKLERRWLGQYMAQFLYSPFRSGPLNIYQHFPERVPMIRHYALMYLATLPVLNPRKIIFNILISISPKALYVAGRIEKSLSKSTPK